MLDNEKLKEMKEFYDSSEKYIDILDYKSNPYRFQVAKSYVSLLSSESVLSNKFLDLGCGTGFTSKLLSDENLNVVGLDISEHFIKSKKYYESDKLNYIVGDLTLLPFQNGSFDIVGSNDVIEHILDVDKALKEMIRVVKPNGKIIIVSPNLLSPIRPLLALLKKEDIHLYDNSRLKAALAIFRNIYYIISKQLSSKVNFIDRQPRLENFRGPDDDAVYWSCYIDLAFWFKKNGYKVKRASFNPRSNSYINKIRDMLLNIIPFIDKGICIVVTKDNKSNLKICQKSENF
jgi:ubiquinone/menaquinone biosynthesis C-methylase UbiE